MVELKIGQIYYNESQDYFWLIIAKNEEMYFGRISQIKNPGRLELAMKLNGELTDKNSFKINDEISIGYNNILNEKLVETEDPKWDEHVLLVTEISEETLKEFKEKETVWIKENNLDSKES